MQENKLEIGHVPCDIVLQINYSEMQMLEMIYSFLFVLITH